MATVRSTTSRARSWPRSAASLSCTRTSSTASWKDRVRAHRARVMSMDLEHTDLNQGRGCGRPCVRPDADYALSWIRSHGKGRVFFTALGHTPAFFASADLSGFFFRGIQIVLGDLEADTTPSAKTAKTTRR